MQNSQMIKSILVTLAREDKLPTDMNELDESVFEFMDVYPTLSFMEKVVARIDKLEKLLINKEGTDVK